MDACCILIQVVWSDHDPVKNLMKLGVLARAVESAKRMWFETANQPSHALHIHYLRQLAAAIFVA